MIEWFDPLSYQSATSRDTISNDFYFFLQHPMPLMMLFKKLNQLGSIDGIKGKEGNLS